MFIKLRMGSFDAIKGLLVDISVIAGDEAAMYGVFFIAGSVLTYQFLNHVIFQKFLKGKAGNAISGLLTLIIIGGLFQAKNC